jgi:hypothetical protein
MQGMHIMAIVNIISETHGRLYWDGLTAGDTGEALVLSVGGSQSSVYVAGTFGGTVTIEGTIDGVNWFPLLTSPGGQALTFTSAGYAEVTTSVYAIRPSAGSGVSDVDVWFRVYA